MTLPWQIGVDLGGTKIEAVLMNSKDIEVSRKRVYTPPSDTANRYHHIIETISQLVGDISKPILKGEEYSLGIGIPGIIDPYTGIIINGSIRELTDSPFKSDIEKIFERTIVIENDANCFTLAEAFNGAGKGFDTVFGITMGTGCGSALCIKGRIHKGRHGSAGEFGHMSMDPAGTKCFCGNNGCIETKISGSGIEKTHFMRTGQKLKMKDIIDGFHAGNRECSQTFNQFIEDFGCALGGLISLLDPDVIVLGGGLSDIDELYSSGIEKIKQYTYHPNITTPILKHKLGDSAGVFGAAWAGNHNLFRSLPV